MNHTAQLCCDQDCPALAGRLLAHKNETAPSSSHGRWLKLSSCVSGRVQIEVFATGVPGTMGHLFQGSRGLQKGTITVTNPRMFLPGGTWQGITEFRAFCCVVLRTVRTLHVLSISWNPVHDALFASRLFQTVVAHVLFEDSWGWNCLFGFIPAFAGMG